MTPALLLCGGRATRLRPLSDELPKALMPLGPTCVFELQLLWLRQHGVSEIAVAAGGATDAIQDRFGRGDGFAVNLAYVPEQEPLGSGGVLRTAAANWRAPFWVINGDVLTALDLPLMAEQHTATGALASIALAAVDDVSGFGAVELGPCAEILRFVEKPDPKDTPSHFVNAGVWRVEPDALALLPPSGFASVEYDLFPAIRARGGRLQGFLIDGYWLDLGTPERYRRAAMDFVADRVPTPGRWPEVRDSRFIGRGSKVGEAATVSSSLIGARCDVRAGARIERSVLWDEIDIGAGATVRDSIIGSGARIASGVTIDGAVVGQRSLVTRDLALGEQVATGKRA